MGWGVVRPALGWAVALLFFASGMFLMSRLVRSASPHAFFAVAMTVYLGQVTGLLFSSSPPRSGLDPWKGLGSRPSW